MATATNVKGEVASLLLEARNDTECDAQWGCFAPYGSSQ